MIIFGARRGRGRLPTLCLRHMAGHSKWHNIRHKKGRNDALKGQMYGRLSRAIIAASKSCGGDEGDADLQNALRKARDAKMPKDRIAFAVERGVKAASGDGVDTVRYEATGPGGVAVIVDALTDNRARTAGEIKHLFSKHDGQLTSVAYMFDRRGLLSIPAPGDDGDAGDGSEDGSQSGDGDDDGLFLEHLFMAALEAGAEDVGEHVREDGTVAVLCDPASLGALRTGLAERGFPSNGAGLIAMVPNLLAEVGTDDDLEALSLLLDALDEHDDVQNVFHNLKGE